MAYDVTLQRRIRELCAQATSAGDDMEELAPILSELRQALREHLSQLKNMVAHYPFAPVDLSKVVTLDPARNPPDEKEKAS